MGKVVRILGEGTAVEIEEVGFAAPHTSPGPLILPPPQATTDGYVLTAKRSASGGADWEAASGGGGSSLVTSVTVTLTNSQILNILATPITLVTPAAGTAILTIAGWGVHDFRNGVYSDAVDQLGDCGIFGASSGIRYFNQIPIADDAMNGPAPLGAVRFLSMMTALPDAGVSWTHGPVTGAGTQTQIIAESLVLQKAYGSTEEFTGGGSGNTLKITLYYIAVSTT